MQLGFLSRAASTTSPAVACLVQRSTHSNRVSLSTDMLLDLARCCAYWLCSVAFCDLCCVTRFWRGAPRIGCAGQLQQRCPGINTEHCMTQDCCYQCSRFVALHGDEVKLLPDVDLFAVALCVLCVLVVCVCSCCSQQPAMLALLPCESICMAACCAWQASARQTKCWMHTVMHRVLSQLAATPTEQCVAA